MQQDGACACGTGDLEPFYWRIDGIFYPTPSAASPWNGRTTNGVALAGLVGLLLDEACDTTKMVLTRLTIDIMGLAPLEPTTGAVHFTRRGGRLQMAEITLTTGGRIVVKASAVLMRERETPPRTTVHDWPDPETLPTFSDFQSRALNEAVDIRLIEGSYRDAGRGAMWIRLIREVVGGVPLSPMTRAALASDFGSGIGSFLHPRDFSYANVDIDLHMLRAPRGEWLILEADTDSAGNGVALVTSAFHDQDGLFARGHQTLFIEPRERNQPAR